MAESYELAASPRERIGKGGARSSRRDGMIPAVIYGGGEGPIAVSLGQQEVSKRIFGGGFLTTVATLIVDGKKVRVLPRDYQLDPVKDRPMHVDFMRITAGSRIVLDIPVRFINDIAAPGIKRGGVLNIVRHAIRVSCPADAIPDHITCDLTGLDINDSLHISAVALPEGVRPTIARDFTVATIASPAGLKEEAAAAQAAAAAAAGAPEGEAGEEATAATEEKAAD
ncbi:MAG: 50S ribosomal protein L25/general stress protein Ctc [Bauldia sp.]